MVVFVPYASCVPLVLQIGHVSDAEFPQYKPDSGFYRTMRERVGSYFAENDFHPKNPIPGIWRMSVVYATAAACFFAVNNCFDIGYTTKVAAAVVFGICQALPLLHVMHDSSHTAFGPTETWWKLAGRFAMEWYAGASMMSWQHQHVVGHHIYTNVMGADPDMPVVEQGDPRRLVARQVSRLLNSGCSRIANARRSSGPLCTSGSTSTSRRSTVFLASSFASKTSQTRFSGKLCAVLRLRATPLCGF